MGRSKTDTYMFLDVLDLNFSVFSLLYLVKILTWLPELQRVGESLKAYSKKKFEIGVWRLHEVWSINIHKIPSVINSLVTARD